MCQVLFPSQWAPCLAGWLLQQNSLGSSYLDKNLSTLSEHSALTGSDWVCHTTFYFPIAVKTCWIISIKFENFRKRSSPARQLSGKKWFQIVLSVNFLSGQRLVRTMEQDECFQRHTKNGPDYDHQQAREKLSQNWLGLCLRKEYIISVRLVLAGVLIIPDTTDITLTVSTFKGSPASSPPPPPPPPSLHWANELLADPHYSSLGYFCNLWFGLNKYVDKNTQLIDQNNMRWAVSALENDSLAWKIGPPSFSVVVGSDKAGAGEEWKIWEIIQFLPRYLSSHFSSIMWTQNLLESISRYLLLVGAEESILSISWHSAGWSLLAAWDASLGALQSQSLTIHCSDILIG